jgi:hypothetical protein
MSRADAQLYRAKITRNAVGAPRRDPAPVPLPRSGWSGTLGHSGVTGS